ncbi:hypothetical protein BGZ60DRAFT_468294 [Tricladium varicosporioides]|nr:hypothetical protein BGZ60DRAFT_468294 [Hymenoscyphus varicosporioides]
MPACTECRRRKLGCSKELPTCKECRRLGAECVYGARGKPGIKSGAVENLNRRIDKIEQLLEHMQTQTTSPPRSESISHLNNTWRNSLGEPSAAFDLLHMFERQLQEFRTINQNGVLTVERDSTSLNSQSQQNLNRSDPSLLEPEMKRRRLNSNHRFDWGEHLLASYFPEIGNANSLSELLDDIVNNYFSQVHPWLPMLHETRFRQQISENVYDANFEVILNAIVYASAKFAEYPDPLLSVEQVSHLTKSSRDWVMRCALNSLSVANLQALLVVAFTDIGNGESLNAWSIVGSLTRTVEYLQLSVEVEEDDEQPLLKPCNSFPPPKDWTEMETRRRVFWNVFNLDRWNTSLTSDDVHRRLPVDGALWRKQQPILAPFFGIWDKSAGRIGNSITLLPTSPNEEQHQSPKIQGGFDEQTTDDGISAIGAFAYCIEATESMSRVTTYFLQQKINLHDQKQIGRWLTRFKELDLRLVHWKMFLPQKWKDTNISRKPSEMIMDPNLTLAHITHNASMILLHQLIAFPPADWTWANRLPSHCSADTCQAAAMETSSITENYLRSPTTSKIVNSQFIFCVFVAARVLLVHWQYYQVTNIVPEFFKLVESLESLSTRWEGAVKMHDRSNLAAMYACLLHSMHEKCVNDRGFRIDILGFVPSSVITQAVASSEEKDEFAKRGTHFQVKQNEISHIPVQKTQVRMGREEQRGEEWRANRSKRATEHVSSRSPAQQVPEIPPIISTPEQVPIDQASYLMPYPVGDSITPGPGMAMEDFSSISQLFLDQQFLDRDRIISYNDGMFTDMGWWDQENNIL